MGSSLESAKTPWTSWHLSHSSPRKIVPRRRATIVEISLESTEIVDELIKEAKILLKAGREKDADKLLNIAERIVNNNRKFQNMVGDLLYNTD